MRRTASFTLVMAIFAAGCSHHEPGIYDLAREDAFARLQQADIGALSDARGCGLPLDIGVQASPPQSVRWVIKAKDTELTSFTVRLETVAPSTTRATVDFGTSPNATATLTTPTGAPALRQPLQGAVVEFVDAALNDRQFDVSRIGYSRPAAEACARKGGNVDKTPAHVTSEAAPVVFGEPSSQMGNPWGFGNSPQGSQTAPVHRASDGEEPGDPPLGPGEENHVFPPPEG